MNNNGGNRFFDGFLLGVIVGALAFYLFGTKSGKRIVKTLSEEGMEGFQKLVEDFRQAQDEVDDEVTEESVVLEDNELETKTVVKPKKRFFRRFKRVD